MKKVSIYLSTHRLRKVLNETISKNITPKKRGIAHRKFSEGFTRLRAIFPVVNDGKVDVLSTDYSKGCRVHALIQKSIWNIE